MADLQNTIKGLRCHSEPKFGPDEYFCETCPYDEATCGLDVPNDALSLLKAQEPRIMTVEEAEKHAYSYYHTPDSVKPVFVQFRDETYSDEAMTPPWRGGVNQRALLKDAGRYGRDFVFWTDRPSEEQMKGVEWDAAN